MRRRGALAAALAGALGAGGLGAGVLCAGGCVAAGGVRRGSGAATAGGPGGAAAVPAPVARFRLPRGAFTDLGEGLVRTVPVEVVNAGKAPFVILGFRISGAATGRRSLVIPAGPGTLRAFGFVPPGAVARYRLAFYFPTPGAGRVHLVARLRPLSSDAPGRLMEERPLPAEGRVVRLRREIPVRVAPRGFTRAAAEARIGGPADDAVYVRTLHAWVLKRGNGTFVVEVGDTIPFPGLSLAAAALLDEYDGAVPVVDDAGRLREVPKGPALRLLLDRARRDGLSVTVTSQADGKRALRVGR